ncbi:hypothetical protein HHL24_17120 [Paraburkholderia sp. RP-4-7]|uniref:Uncharacterized protein n=1 Tax=Paraburkholderia polaris TaxID=2728848 RepID=A0A848IDF6_9BURK|nr:hypothetical protein [Paraburkholderia polaris]NML99650.1 hypothetical protein [Paraburkholderia polaris]
MASTKKPRAKERAQASERVSAVDRLCIVLTKAFDANAKEDDRGRAIGAVSQLLDGARRRGFANTGALLTMAANGAEARCFESLAREAMAGATDEELEAAIGQLREGGK